MRAQTSDEALRKIRLCERGPGSLAAEAHFVRLRLTWHRPPKASTLAC